MNVFHFGDPDRPLLGAHHEPPPATDLGRAAVFCAPIGQEYMRTHWCMRRLADRLARAGVHVMRFDYTGQGDSSGGDEDASVDTWTGDVVDAIEEIRDASGAIQVSLVGLRFGSALAARAATRCDGIEKLILWDPVRDGRTYLAQLRTLHEQRLERWKFAHDPGGIEEGREELLGRTWPTDFLTEVAAFTFPEDRPKAREIHVLTSADCAEHVSIGSGWGDAPANRQVLSSAGYWDVVDEVDEALLASPIEAAITDILAAKT